MKQSIDFARLVVILLILGAPLFSQSLLTTGDPAEKKLGEIPKDHELSSPVQFSPDGTQFAYVAKANGGTRPVIGDWVGEAFHYISPPLFGAKGDQVVFRIGKQISKTKEKWWILRGKKKTGEADWIGEPGLSPGGKTLVYWIQPGASMGQDRVYNQKPMHLVVNGKKGVKWDDGSALQPIAFSSKKGSFATVARKGNQYFVVRDLKKKSKKALGYSMIDSPTLSANGKKLAFAAVDASKGSGGPPGGMGGMLNQKWVIVWGKKKLGGDYDNAGCPSLSSNGKKIAYKVQQGGKMGIAVGTKLIKPKFDFVRNAVFSPKGDSVAYAANTGGTVDPHWAITEPGNHGVKGGSWQLIHGKSESTAFDDIDSVNFSPSGKVVTFRAKKGAKWLVVCGDKKSQEFDHVSPPRFSPDGSKVAYGARLGRELWWKVMAVK